MADITTKKKEENGAWLVEVTISEGSSETHHRVRVEESDLSTLKLSANIDVDALVQESFRFLLEREGKESILSSFDLLVIRRYFPEYPEEIRKRFRTKTLMNNRFITMT